MRTPLSKGAIIPLNGKQYHIDGVIGEGASCIVYDASVRNPSGITYHYRLKECSPYNAQYRRAGNQIVWEDEAQKQAAFDRFTKAAQVIADLRSQESLGNDITETELCEGNGTLYAVMSVNHAKTYSFDNSKDLHRILQTMLKLTRIVGRLHEQGYLHLDIKPDNFLVHYDPDPNIWLFDVDSLVPIADLQSGRTTCYSYSKEWAAPELSQGKLSKVCPATDLFSIGAILFSKVMGRSVFNDDMGLFADWDFKGEQFEAVNPKVQRYLREIFRKTLSVSVKRRFQTAPELCKILENACTITSAGKPFLISCCPQLTTGFVGRQEELSQISQAFHSGHRTVFLHGEGAIGKSTLALAYGNSVAKAYDAVLFCRYRGSLENMLDNIAIQNFDGDEKAHRTALERLLDRHILLIIDNFDVEVNQDAYLDELLKLHAHLLFTTRTDFNGVLGGNVAQIEVSALSENHLLQLFSESSKTAITESNQTESVRNLIRLVDYNTYAVELLAKQVVASGHTVESLLRKMSTGLDALAHSERIKANKDGQPTKNTILDIFRQVYGLANLSGDRVQVLQNLFLLRFLNVDINTYRKFACCNSIDDLNDLVEIGLVRKYDSFFLLHPIIEELIRIDFLPHAGNHTGVFEYIKHKIFMCRYYDDYDEVENRKYANNCSLLCHFFINNNLSQADNLSLCIEWLRTVWEQVKDCRTDVLSPEENEYKLLYESLSRAATKVTNPSVVFDVYSFLASVWLYQYNCLYLGGNDEVDSRNAIRDTSFEKYFYSAIRAANALPEEETAKKTTELYEDVFYHLSASDSVGKFPKKLLHRMVSERPEVFDFDLFAKEYYGLEVTEADRVKDKEKREAEIAEYLQNLPNCGTHYEEDWKKYVDSVEHDLLNKDTFRKAASDLVQNNAIKIHQKVGFLDDALEWWLRKMTIRQYPGNIRNWINEQNWDDICYVISLMEELIFSPDFKEGIEYDSYELLYDEFVCYPTTDAKVSGFCPSRNSLQEYKSTVALVHSDYPTVFHNLEQYCSLEFHEFWADKVCFNSYLQHITNCCFNLGKCHLILPYMIDAISEYTDEESLGSIIPVLDDISAFSNHAANEVGENNAHYHNYQRVQQIISSIIDIVTAKDYLLKGATPPLSLDALAQELQAIAEALHADFSV